MHATADSPSRATERDGYRADIDGLRAVAVLGVVAYHLGLGGGGFVGVDIFFVISGFLITRLLVAELANGPFSLSNVAHFYERRILRIMPALTAMCVVTYAAATAVLFPEDLKEFGRSLQSVAVFASNLHFQRKVGYFDAAADEKPLLHTWSLAVEEQYYLAFPLLLWMLWRWRGALGAAWALAAIAFASLIYSEAIVRDAPETAFFSTPARIWELLAGALLVVAPGLLPTRKVVREAMAATGALLIAWAYVSFSPETSFPGATAMLPVAGAALLIAAGNGGTTLLSQVLATPPLVGVGLISYSVYLWHWPLMVLAKYRFSAALEYAPVMAAFAMFALSLIAGYLSWRFVEMPFRRPASRPRQRRVFAGQTAVMLATVVSGLLLSKTDGLPARWPGDVLAMLQPHAELAGAHAMNCVDDKRAAGPRLSTCTATADASPASKTVLLWGDSHAGMLRDALAGLIQPDQMLTTAISAGCPPLLDVVLGGRGRSEKCRADNVALMGQLAQRRLRASTVILAARWAYYAEGTRMPFEPGLDVVLGGRSVADAPQILSDRLAATVTELLKYSDRVVLVAPFPEFDRPVAVALVRARAWQQPHLPDQPHKAVARRQSAALMALQRAVAIDPQRVSVVSPLRYLCDADACAAAGADGTPLYTDTNHLSAVGIARIKPLLDELLAD